MVNHPSGSMSAFRKGVAVFLLLALTLTSGMHFFVHSIVSNPNPSCSAGSLSQSGCLDASDGVQETGAGLDKMYFSPSPSSDGGVYYVCRRGVDTVAYFGKSEVSYIAEGDVLRLAFPGSREVIPLGEEPTGSVTNYLLGNDASRWRTGLTDYAALRYRDIYPGIDLVYRIVDGHLKYEFTVAPYVDPSPIRLSYLDADTVDIRKDSVVVSRGHLAIVDSGLKAFQEDNGTIEVSCTFRSEGGGAIGLSVGRHDPEHELVIDPVLLSYSTFLGGSSEDIVFGIALDGGSVYVTGWTLSSDFPTVNAYCPTSNGSTDCFVVKFAADGHSLLYSTFFGGVLEDTATDIAVESGLAYITGYTYSSNFPTVCAYDSTPNGEYDCFVTKFAADGQSLLYSTFLGGTSADFGYGIAVESGCAHVAGYTMSSDFSTVNAYDSTYGGNVDCFVAKFAADGQSLVYSSFLGGSDYEEEWCIAVENGSAYVTGHTYSSDFPTVNAYDPIYNGNDDCFLTKLAADGQSLVYSTFLGGSETDYAFATVIENGSAYVTGYTGSSDFPTVNAYDSTLNGEYDCFVTKLATDGKSLVYSTFLGGTAGDIGRGIAADNGSVYVTGCTSSSDFPIVNAYDSTTDWLGDCFVAKLASEGSSLIYSTFLGGPSNDDAIDIEVWNGSAYIAGRTESSEFPTVNGYDSIYGGSGDGFVAVISENGLTTQATEFDSYLLIGIAGAAGIVVVCVFLYTRSRQKALQGTLPDQGTNTLHPVLFATSCF